MRAMDYTLREIRTRGTTREISFADIVGISRCRHCPRRRRCRLACDSVKYAILNIKITFESLSSVKHDREAAD